ncbi:MAG: type II toxin-antitoxin system PemK/MazF family toxin [Candidatus Latescibacteria bacterium]|nr:type II toxin-antitoxin system PemK/MazF family toxin [Candidatus Latescibacterota bacterium]
MPKLKPKRGEIWLVRFPFTDLTSTKLRPALVLAVHGKDSIVMGIFSRVPVGRLSKTWVLIEDSHPAFPQIGLRKASLLKAEKIAVVHESVFQRKLGNLPPDIMVQMQDALKKALLIS